MPMASSFIIGFIVLVFVFTNEASTKNQRQFRPFKVVPNTYLVEFQTSFTRRFQKNQFDEFYRQVANSKAGVRTRMNLTSKFFDGASFFISNPDRLASLKALDSVKEMWPVSLIERPIIEKHNIFNVGEDNIQPRDSSEESSYPPHKMTGVDTLHTMGYFGQGVKIAVIDSGVDYTHPDLGGGFGSEYKISFGYDFAGDDYVGSNDPIPDDDPFTNCNEHGTHVTGIIGAQGRFFTGVAPNATLGMYRVFGCTGYTSTDMLISAYTAAEQSGANIITASIGGLSGWTNDPWAIVVNRIAKTGVTCILSAGNNGDLGPFSGSSGASAPASIAVASVDAIDTPLLKIEAKYKIRNRRKKIFHYFSSARKFPVSFSGYRIITVNKSSIENQDACLPLPTNTTFPSDAILLIKYGKCDWKTQYDNLLEANAVRVIFFGNSDYSIISEWVRIRYGVVKKPLLQVWIGALSKGKSIRLFFPAKSPAKVTFEPNLKSGGQISWFSTWYPTNDLYFKPEVAAPGGYIFSTIPQAMGSYAVFSGTSMAAPYVAGIAALYLGAKGISESISGLQLKNTLLSTATQLNYSYNYGNYSYLAPTVQQGLGLTNGLAFLQSNTHLNVSTIALNDTDNFIGIVPFTVSNIGNTTTTYTFSHVDVGTFYMFQELPDSLLGASNLSTLLESYATVTCSPPNITLNPGSTETIIAEFLVPSDLQAELLPCYSGFIQVTSSNQETQHIAYLGVAGSMKDLDLNANINAGSVLQYSEIDSEELQDVQENQTINFNTTQLTLYSVLMMGTPLVTVDVIGNVGNIPGGEMSNIGTVADFPVKLLPNFGGKVDMFYGWLGTLSSGNTLEPGVYYLVVRILKIFGDENVPTDYYTWRSPTFIVIQ